ncbi:DUF4946 domain-containing protein [Pseudomonas aeruginosa]|nr:DUF4946 domain-containing protein [Pseudomonas aeruginosa]
MSSITGYLGAGWASADTTTIRSNLGGLASLETHCRISQGYKVLKRHRSWQWPWDKRAMYF